MEVDKNSINLAAGYSNFKVKYSLHHSLTDENAQNADPLAAHDIDRLRCETVRFAAAVPVAVANGLVVPVLVCVVG